MPNPAPPTAKPVACKNCNTQIAATRGGRLIIGVMKSVSTIEVSEESTDIKCRQCNSWNSFVEGNQYINYKRKAEDALYNHGKL